MSLGRHPPAGRPVPASALAANRDSHPTSWGDCSGILFQSATEALAIAIRQAFTKLSPGSPRRVALPAYACPNLTAATLWAGGSPEYYDLDRDSFGPEQGSLATLQAAGELVIVHVDAFGADTWSEQLAGAPVVHDLAQSFAAFEKTWTPRAPLTVVSFGRAKPVSLTLGGALIAVPDIAGSMSLDDLSTGELSPSKLALRARIYNLSLRPLPFGLLARVPQLGIGTTVFKPLTKVTRLPAWCSGAVDAARLALSDSWALLVRDTAEMLQLAQSAGARVPRSALEARDRMPLWRVPVLCPTIESAAGLAAEGAEFGLSRLYGRPLPQIMGASAEEAVLRWPNASWLAQRLVTLPTHGRLGARSMQRLQSLLRRYFQ